MIEHLPPLLVIAALLLYLVGKHRIGRRTDEPASWKDHLEAVSFYSAIGLMLLVLDAPIYDLAYKLFWVHMIQHLVLLTVAPPLIVLARPWRPMWSGLPMACQRAFKSFLAQRALKPILAGARALASPTGAWLLFNAGVVIWHIPGPYDLTLRSVYVHLVEHAMFLVFGILFWAQVIGVAPATSPLPYWRRIPYVAGTMLTNIALSIVLAFVQHPLYAPYAQLSHRPGGISALADQQIGAGIMWTAGDLPFTVALAILVQRVLAEHESRTFGALEAMVTRPSDGLEQAGKPDPLETNPR